MLRLLFAAALFASAACAECPVPPPAVRDLLAESYYDDAPVFSHIDPLKLAAYEAQVKPVEDYLHAIVAMADRGDKPCAVRWLKLWADNGALAGRLTNDQAHFERRWFLSGVALAYAKVRDGAGRNDRAAIDGWLITLATAVQQQVEASHNTHNNLYYWAGLAVTAAAAVTQTPAQLEFGRKVLREAEGEIADDGTLPLELKRGGRALHYLMFAAEPLAMLETILNEHSPKLKKLAYFCIDGSADPEIVAKRVGVPQIGIGTGDMDWASVYLRHNPPETGTMIRYSHTRPDVTRLGGDISKANPLEHAP